MNTFKLFRIVCIDLQNNFEHEAKRHVAIIIDGYVHIQMLYVFW